MIYDPLPPANNWSVWEVMVEFLDIEDNTPIDFSVYPNIKLEILDPWSGAIAHTLSRNGDAIVTPVPGIIEWRIGQGQMTGFHNGTYKVRLSVWQDSMDDAIGLIDSTVAITGD